MNLRPRPQDELELNITPLIDVVFLLLIFFMVSTTFTRETQIKIVLPEAEAEARQSAANELELVIDAGGNYFIGEQALPNTSLAQLRLSLGEAAAGREDRPLIIRADAGTPHQAVMKALDAAGQLGLSRITFAAAQRATAEP